MSAPRPDLSKCDPKILRPVPETERHNPHRDRTVGDEDDLEWFARIERELLGERESGPSGSPSQHNVSTEPEDDAADPEEEEGEQGFGELSAEEANVFFEDRAAQAASSASAL
tara:strand:+ start:349 stop:687 length:339 start_codon:yes stop_codon:yes gene_type:complete